MKVLPFNIPKPENAALVFQIDREPVFYDRLHQHEEIQISLILHGEGEVMAGDSIRRYQAGDLFIFGSYMPHLFKTDESIPGTSHMLSIFFTNESFGNFFGFEEIDVITPLLKEIENGMQVLENIPKIESHFKAMEDASPIDRLIHFLSILKWITQSKRESLSSMGQSKLLSENEGMRMQKVMSYAMNEFHRSISLEEISEVASMTPNAFCRYFKQRTNKTFFQLLIEIRLEHACTLLRKKIDLSVAEVSDLSGFKNLSNFNRKFKEHKGQTPSQFRKTSLVY